jgi:hypothetical protein
VVAEVLGDLVAAARAVVAQAEAGNVGLKLLFVFNFLYLFENIFA